MWRGLSVLKVLYLHDNDITTLNPRDFDHLPRLETLVLEGNPLTTISHNIFNSSLYPETDGHPSKDPVGLWGDGL